MSFLCTPRPSSDSSHRESALRERKERKEIKDVNRDDRSRARASRKTGGWEKR